MLKVKAERLRRNWTQTDLGYHARITPAEISRIETGRLRPYPGQLERLAKVLNVETTDLLLDVVDTEQALLEGRR
jgi:transcriptional regulator with XRE-family HTH domain